MQAGDIVKLRNPGPGESAARFVVIECHCDVARPRAIIQLLDSGMAIPPIETVLIEDVEPCAS